MLNILSYNGHFVIFLLVLQYGVVNNLFVLICNGGWTII